MKTGFVALRHIYKRDWMIEGLRASIIKIYPLTPFPIDDKCHLKALFCKNGPISFCTLRVYIVCFHDKINIEYCKGVTIFKPYLAIFFQFKDWFQIIPDEKSGIGQVIKEKIVIKTVQALLYPVRQKEIYIYLCVLYRLGHSKRIL